LFVVVALLLSAVLAALAALATPLLAVAPGLLGSAAVVFAVVFVVAALPRLGFTTVVPLDTVEISVLALCVLVWLKVRCGLEGALGAGRGGGSICPRVDVVVVFSFEAVRLSLDAAPRFACSSMPCIDAEMADVAAVAAVLSGEAGLRGDVGRAIMLFAGEVGAIK
jgi:hypothetical protein